MIGKSSLKLHILACALLSNSELLDHLSQINNEVNVE